MRIPVAFWLGDIPFAWRGLIISLAILAAFVFAKRDELWMGLPGGTISKLGIVMLPAAFIGARVFFIVFSLPLSTESASIFSSFFQGGTALFGGLMTGFATAYVFCNKKSLSFARVCETVAAPLILGIAIGRWADLVNMESFGPVIQLGALQRFPFAIYIESLKEWRLALFFFESLACFVIFFGLMFKRAELKARGDALAFALLSYSAVRIITESLREDSLYLGFVRISQLAFLLTLLAITAVFAARAWERQSVRKNIIVHAVLDICFLTAAFLCEFFMAKENILQNHIILTASVAAMAVVSMRIYYYINIPCGSLIHYEN